MSFGLTNAPKTFMSFMNGIFKSFLASFIIVFINDIFICSKSKEEASRTFVHCPGYTE